MLVRKAEKDEWEEAMALAWRVFQKFDAKDYTEEGIESFLNFISDNGLYKMFLSNEYKLFVAESGGKIVGVSSLRMRNHISLLFVEPQYHHQGIATALLKEVFKHTRTKGMFKMTVNSSPYAVQFYHKLGFVNTDHEICADGIRYTPMEITI